MSKFIAKTLLVLLCLFGASSSSAQDEPSAKDWTVKPKGWVTNYFLFNSRPFFTTPNRTWMETTAAVGGEFQYKEEFTAHATLMGIKTSGNDAYGDTGAANPSPAFDVDQAFIRYKPFGDDKLALTIGRQYIVIGDGFIVSDGIFDGFAGVTQGVFSASRKGFDAFRVRSQIAGFDINGIFFFVSPTYDGGFNRDGLFGGVDISRKFESIGGDYAVGGYFRTDSNKDDNRMAVFTGRVKQQIKPVPGNLYVSGEFVYEYGGCYNALYCDAGNTKLRDFAWHAEVGYEATQWKLKPSIEAGYAYFTDEYNPLFYGFMDWNKWFIGNQMSWLTFNSNAKVIRANAGFYPHDKVRMRLFYANTSIVEGVKGTLANEFMLVNEWFPNDWLWFSLCAGYSMGTDKIVANGYANLFVTPPIPAGQDDSADIVFGAGVNF